MNKSTLFFGAGLVVGILGSSLLTPTAMMHGIAASTTAPQSITSSTSSDRSDMTPARTDNDSEKCVSTGEMAPDKESVAGNQADTDKAPSAEQIALYHTLQQRLHNTAYNHELSLTELVNQATGLTPQQQQELRSEALAMIERGELTQAQFMGTPSTTMTSSTAPDPNTPPTPEQLDLYNHMQTRIYDAVRDRSASLSDLLHASSQLTPSQKQTLHDMVSEMIARGELSESQFVEMHLTP